MPALDVKRRAKDKPYPSRRCRRLAADYRVSAPAMLIRLRNLGLWKAELVLWHEMTNGTFAVKRLVGRKDGRLAMAGCRNPRAAFAAS